MSDSDRQKRIDIPGTAIGAVLLLLILNSMGSLNLLRGQTGRTIEGVRERQFELRERIGKLPTFADVERPPDIQAEFRSISSRQITRDLRAVPFNVQRSNSGHFKLIEPENPNGLEALGWSIEVLTDMRAMVLWTANSLQGITRDAFRANGPWPEYHAGHDLELQNPRNFYGGDYDGDPEYRAYVDAQLLMHATVRTDLVIIRASGVPHRVPGSSSRTHSLRHEEGWTAMTANGHIIVRLFAGDRIVLRIQCGTGIATLRGDWEAGVTMSIWGREQE